MKTAWIVVPLVLLNGGVAARAQSLAELAQKEKERRAAKAKEAKPAGASRVITQEDLDRAAADRPAESGTPDGAPAPGGTPSAGASTTRSSGSHSPMGIPDDSGERARLEKSWKARAEATRNAVKAAERELERAQGERNRLGTGPLAGSTFRDPLTRDKVVVGGENPAEWTKRANAADARLAGAKAALESAKRNLETFEEEARRAGIPPGWVR